MTRMSITLLDSKMSRIAQQSIGKGNAIRSRNQIQQLNNLKKSDSCRFWETQDFASLHGIRVLLTEMAIKCPRMVMNDIFLMVIHGV